jgi:hypothetical protein
MDLFDLLSDAVNIYIVLKQVLHRSFNDAVSISASILLRINSVKLKGLERKRL